MFGGGIGVFTQLRSQFQQAVLEELQLILGHIVRFGLLDNLGFRKQTCHAHGLGRGHLGHRCYRYLGLGNWLGWQLDGLYGRLGGMFGNSLDHRLGCRLGGR